MSGAIFGKGGETKLNIVHAWDWHTSLYQDTMDMYLGTLQNTIDNDMLVVSKKDLMPL